MKRDSLVNKVGRRYCDGRGNKCLGEVHLIKEIKKKTSRCAESYRGKQEEAIVEAEIFLDTNADPKPDQKGHQGEGK